MKCVRCGNDRFFADQVCYHEVITDEHGNFEENYTGTHADGIYDAESPHGPFQCTKCKAFYEKLEDGEKPYGY